MAVAGSGSVAQSISQIEASAYSKVNWRLMPYLFICYIFCFLDRVNVGFAKLQMQQQLGFSETVYGLAAGIWTKDISKAHSLAAEMRAGTVWINCYNIFDAAMPFGGYKQSGWGREMGHEALELYTETKAICARIG